MKSRKISTMSILLGTALLLGTSLTAMAVAGLPGDLAGLEGPFDLGGEFQSGVRYYVQETQYVHIGFDGKRTGIETYTVVMHCVPAVVSGKDGDEYTISSFSIKAEEGQSQTLPALAGWSYILKVGESGMDDAGQVFGIPHSRFENLTKSDGSSLSVGESYPVYNSFIDFHSFNDVFARPGPEGRGIQDLRAIGQEIVHYSAFSEPPVDLGNGIKEGSFFRNGEIRLTFKGLSIVDGAACALVGFDSGESTLRMLMPISAEADMEVVGGSQYIGDLYIDLATHWVNKVTFDEFVIHETRLPMMGQGTEARTIREYTIRHLLTRLISREEFEMLADVCKED